MTISALITEAGKKAGLKVQKRCELQQVPYINYSAPFGEFLLKALIQLGSKINTIQPSFAKKPSFHICNTNVGAQKIDVSKMETDEKIIVFIQVDDKNRMFCFFEETFLFDDISMDVAFGILFFTLSNIEINFNN